MNKKKPTQIDVARAAGVSQATVSYVLNGNTSVSVPDETRQRILSAAEMLSYVPDYAARSLRTQKTHTIAAIIPDINNPFYPTFARGIQDVVRHHNYDLILYNTDELAAEERKCLRSVQRGRVDGIIIVPFHSKPEELQRLTETKIAEVVVVSPIYGPYSDLLNTVGADDRAAAQVAVEYLIQKGHNRIAMVVGKDGPPRQTRIEGYRLALANAGLAYEHVAYGGNFTEEGGYVAMRRVLESGQRPTAVFAANDLMAIGAMRAMREVNLRIPQDMAVIGIDDIPAARLVTPALTTVSQFAEQLGRRAAEILFENLDGKRVGQLIHAETLFQLIIRDSA
jgi:LacI family transcriptional regulator